SHAPSCQTHSLSRHSHCPSAHKQRDEGRGETNCTCAAGGGLSTAMGSAPPVVGWLVRNTNGVALEHPVLLERLRQSKASVSGETLACRSLGHRLGLHQKGNEQILIEPRLEEEVFEERQNQKGTECQACLPDPRARATQQHVIAELPFERGALVRRELGKLFLEVLAFFLYSYRFFDLAFHQKQRQREHTPLNGSGKQAKEWRHPAEPRPCQKQQLGVTQTHTWLSSKPSVNDIERKPNQNETEC